MKSVGIIGAGAAGLCAGRACLRAGYSFVIFEQTDQIGGTWVFHEEPGVHSSMYEKLHTNLPKEIMEFPGFPFRKGPRSFVEHTVVLEYLQDYGREVEKFIRFNSKVLKVFRNFENGTWKVKIEFDKKIENFEFNFIFVCNGHFYKSRIPDFSENLSIPFIHSHDYRSPSDYCRKTVAVVGAGPSGVDIALQLEKNASKIYICHKSHSTTKLKFSKKIEIVPGAKSAKKNELILDDGKILKNLDTVIFCTGYKYFFYFFDSNIVKIKENESYVSSLFFHVAHVNYIDSLFFIGLNTSVLPFTLFDYQINFAFSLMQGRSKFIEKEKIDNWEQDRLRYLSSKGIPFKYFHFLGDSQWSYYEELATLSGIPYSIPPVFQKIYKAVAEGRRTQITNYKTVNYEILSDTQFRQFDSGYRDYF